MLKLLGLLAVVALYLAVSEAQKMNDKLRQVVLDAHNVLRSQVALGKAKNKNGTTLPQATNMMKMTYSKLVEGHAQELANSCNYTHKRVNGTSNNLWTKGDTAGFMDPTEALNTSVYAWFSELESDGQDSLVMNGSNYNHFTQVVWGNSVEIGCAVSNCPNLTDEKPGECLWTYVVCNYSPAGNIDGEGIYKPGKLGAGCPSNAPKNSLGLCENVKIKAIH